MNNVNFKSRYNPVPGFSINTKLGKLNVKEVSLKDKNIDNDIVQSANLFLYNYATNTEDPGFLRFVNTSDKEYKRGVSNFADFIKKTLITDDGNITYLIARDSSGKIQASCITSSLDEFGGVCDKNTLYVNNVAVNKNYRGNHVGSIMTNKIIDASQNRFSDLVLVADNCAIPSYKKGWNLEIFAPKDATQLKALDIMAKSRPDYPDYVNFMHKPLDNNKTRWWERLVTLVEKKETPWWKKLF